MAIIEAQNISKTFTQDGYSLTVLHDISFVVNAGEFLAITGPSGSGKSTLMKIIGCLDIPTSGTYLIEGKKVSNLTPDQLAHIRNKKIGFVFQQFMLLPDLTAIENVALPQLYAGENERTALERAKQKLELVELGHRLDHFPYQLSGGEQQRVAIARALINNPAIVLADEPTGNLDSKTGLTIMDVFMHLNQKEKITIIIITHDLPLAEKTNRIIKLLDGTIIEDKKISHP